MLSPLTLGFLPVATYFVVCSFPLPRLTALTKGYELLTRQ